MIFLLQHNNIWKCDIIIYYCSPLCFLMLPVLIIHNSSCAEGSTQSWVVFRKLIIYNNHQLKTLLVYCLLYFIDIVLLLLLLGEEFSNELPSSSLATSPSSSPPLLPRPESPVNPVTPGNLRLEVAAPHYHENQLQVKVFWKLSNHSEFWTLYKLVLRGKNHQVN